MILLLKKQLNLTQIAYYQYDRNTPPISLGTSVGFVDNAGGHFKFFEMSNITRDNEPTVIEQSKIVSTKTTDQVFSICDSREAGIVFFANSDTTESNRDVVWGYRYFESGPERILSSWFKWKLSGTVRYHCIMRDRYFAVVSQTLTGNINHNQLLSFDITSTDQTSFVDFDNRLFAIHMDNIVPISELLTIYDSNTDTTSWPMVTYAGEPRLFDP